MNIFAIVCSATPELRNIKFYATKEMARTALKKIADDRRFKLGVSVITDAMEKDKFAFLLGWEEVEVRFSIVELPVEQ